jgi:hypothetical protein
VPGGRVVTGMYLQQLTPGDLSKAHEAADYLLRLPVRLDRDLAIKLDTLRADLTAAIEDRRPPGRVTDHAATAISRGATT